MLLQFIKRDPAWKLTPPFAAASAIAALFFGSGHGGAILGAMAGLYTVLFMRAQPHRRATFFEAALPVSGRDLFGARLLSLMALVWLPSIAAVAVLLLTGNALGKVPQIVVVSLILTLGMVVSLTFRIKEFAGPAWVTMATPFCVAGAIIPSVGHAVPVAAVCAAAAIVVGAIAWHAVPEAFQSVPSRIKATRKSTGNATPSLPWWPVIRSLFPWQVAVFIPISLVWSASGDLIFASMYLMMAYAQTRISTRWTLALPISRRGLLAASVLPLLVALAGGVEFGMLRGMVKQGKELIRQGDPDHFRATGAIDVFVNRAFWRTAPAGSVPVIRAPWGETYQPPSVRIPGISFYNPYAVGQKNSLEFQDWQFSRATTDIYGRSMTARELATAKQQDLDPITLRPRMQILTVAATLAIALFWVWLIELFSWHRIGRLSTPLRHTVTYSITLVPILAIFAVDLLLGNRLGSISLAAVEGGLLFLSQLLPANLAVVAALCLLPLAAFFWIADRQAAVGERYGQLQQSKGMFENLKG